MEQHSKPDLFANLIRRTNIGDTLTRTAARLPDQLAIVEGERRVDYKSLDEQVNRMSSGLVASGYKRGDALALIAGNSVEFLLAYYSCAKLGVVCVPVNLGWQPAEIAYVLEHSRARGVVIESQLLERLATVLLDATSLEDVIVAPGIGTSWKAPQSTKRFSTLDDILEAGDERAPQVYVEDRDALTYLYTSGTTAAPKGVVGSHLSIYIESLTSAMENRFGPEDRTVAMMPMFHTAQLNGIVTPIVIVGGTVVIMRAFDPAKMLELIEREHATHVFGLPMMYRALLDHPDVARRDLSSLRRATYAMAPMPDDDLRRAMKVLGCELSLGFGQTEMAPITTVFQPHQQLTHTGSVGTPSYNVQVAIMDDEGRLLENGATGEIVYRGPHAMEGYLRDEAATAAAFAHGWFHSGDIGHFDQDGVLWFEDRKKDVIKTGGENVSSIEVEKALYASDPRIQEAVVVGLPHSHWGEAITAVVVPKPGETIQEAEVLASTKERLAGFKIPKAVVITDQLPHTSTGKVQKHVLRDQLREYYKDHPT